MEVVEAAVDLMREWECVDCSSHRHENDHVKKIVLVDDGVVVAEAELAGKDVANHTDQQHQRVMPLKNEL